MKQPEIHIDVMLDTTVFRRFSFYDKLIRTGRWRMPAGFAGIMLAFAAVCFFMHDRADNAVLLGVVLALIGIVLPLVYLRAFFASVDIQIKQYGLKSKRRVYSLTLTSASDGIYVENNKEETRYAWDAAYGAYRAKRCTYLYITENRAFLLPHEQVSGGADGLWELLKSVMPPEKLKY